MAVKSVKNTRSISFPRMFSPITGKTLYSDKIESINECLRVLLLTNRGELLGDPMYGSNLRRFLFDPNLDFVYDIIAGEIVSTITMYEKRIYVYENDISIENDETSLYLTITYGVKETGTIETFELAVLKEDYEYAEG